MNKENNLPESGVPEINGSTQMKPDYIDFQTKELLRVDSVPAVLEELTSTSTPFILKVPAASTKIKRVKLTPVVVCPSEKSVPRIAGTTTVTIPSIRARTQIHSNETNEQCRKFLTYVLILSNQEPPIIKRNIRTLVQELIDDQVKPENFVVRLARLLDSSPRRCLIKILQQGLPFLRHVLATKELSIKGIRPPPGNIDDKTSMIGGKNPIRSQFKPAIPKSSVRAVGPPGTVVSKTVNQSQLKPVISGSQVRGVGCTWTVVGKPVIQSQLKPVISGSQVREVGRTWTVVGKPAIQSQLKPVISESQVRGVGRTWTVVGKPVIQSQLKPVISGSQGEELERPSAVVGKTAIQSQLKPVISGSQVRGVGRPRTVVRLVDQIMQQRLMTPGQNAIKPDTRLVIRIMSPNSSTPTIVSNTQLPDVRPLYASNQIPNMIRQPLPVCNIDPGQVSPSVTFGTPTPVSNHKFQGNKPVASLVISENLAKDDDIKSCPFAYTDNDNTNDVVAMCDINLAEETQSMLPSIESSVVEPTHCVLNMQCLQERIKSRLAAKGLDEPSQEIAAMISYAAQEKLKHMLEKLSVITEHRLESVKGDSRYSMTNNIEGQLKFLEDVDKAQIKKREEAKREMLVRDASQTGNPEQAKLKAQVKEMQRVEMEEIRQREANITLFRAIGPRKTLKNSALGQLPRRACRKKANMQDLLILFENEKDLRYSNLLYTSYLKQ